MAMTELVPLQIFLFVGLILCSLVDIIKTIDVPYTLLNVPSSFNPVIILDGHNIYKRDVNGTASQTDPPTTQTPQTTPVTREVKDSGSHKYYKSEIATDIAYWDELNDHPSMHASLTDGHRIAVTVGLTFQFPFYGHKIKKVTIATGGFLYMSPFLHSWLTATQYIAPLMANFDTRKGNGSDILYKDYTNRFVVEWRDVYLQDQNHSNPFVFQTTLHQNGSIVFGYKQVPLDVTEITTENHPVKIGVSDAFYVDATVQGITRRTIYEYHRVEVNLTLITKNTVVILEPLLTCNTAQNCETCVTQNDNFECKWCPAVSRCSDGIDWYRQDWLKAGCTNNNLAHNLLSRCSEIYTTTTSKTISGTTCDPTVSKGIGSCNYKSEKNSQQTIGGIIGIVIVLLILIVAIVGWFVYAYRNPTSASGMWLMEHRPSVMKQKIVNMKFFKRTTETGDKYKIETTTDA